MGITGLNILFKKYIPDIKQTRNLNYYKGSTIGIDTSILLYKYIHISNKNNSQENTFIVNFINKIVLFFNHGIMPIFCFDGIPPEEKQHVLNKRYEQKEKLKKKIELHILNGNIEEAEKIKNQLIYVSKDQKAKLIELFNIIKIPYIIAEGEAEELCAYLQKNKIINYTLTEDSDSLVFGCSNILKTTKDKYTYVEYNLNDILFHLKISYFQFIDLCILLGCDYCPSIHRLGPVNGYNIIKKYNNIENFIENNKDYVIPQNFNYKKARQLFTVNTNAKINLKKNIREIQYHDQDKLINYLTNLDFTNKYANILNNKLIASIKNYLSLDNDI